MMSVFSTVAEMPNIRYFDPANARVNKASKLAGYIQEELDLLAQQDPDFPSKDSPAYTGKNGTLLIIERTFDMAAPLLHEFTYQAMINDLLLLQNGKIR